MRILIITLICENPKKIELPIKIILKSDLLTERILLQKSITKATNYCEPRKRLQKQLLLP